MVSARPLDLTPHRRPLQARSSATVDAILDATLQLLVADGPARLTTTRVATRAGVSVGTMYQYFAHKPALIHALNERHLDRLATTMEAACRAEHGAPVTGMVRALVDAYWAAKTDRPEVTRALYRSFVDLDHRGLVACFATRVDVATTAMLATAPDARFADPGTVTLTLLSTVFGTVRNLFERDLPVDRALAVRDQLVLMCEAYLVAASARD